MLTEDDIEKYICAGRIACLVARDAERYVKPEVKLLDLANYIESKIKELGGEPAFPVNISINNIAAHYTPLPRDETIIPSEAVVKIDIGVHVDGYIADTAITVSLSDRYSLLVESVKQALEKALANVVPGKKFSEVGALIEKVVKDHGFKPVYNLSGHNIDRYLIHAGETIPNFNDRLNFGKFQVGRVYAIEPFATNGVGFVVETSTITIYALKYNPKKIRSLTRDTYSIYMLIYNSRKTLPFAKRWYKVNDISAQIDNVLNELHRNNLLIQYPVLIEKSNGIVVQFEHTVLIDNKGSVTITTKC
jgi:methionyl aminopeptidase